MLARAGPPKTPSIAGTGGDELRRPLELAALEPREQQVAQRVDSIATPEPGPARRRDQRSFGPRTIDGAFESSQSAAE